MNMIQAIIFDFGGVLTHNDDLGDIARYLAKKYSVNPKIVDEITWSGWSQARLDPTYDAIFWRDTAAALGLSEAKLQEEYLAFPQLVPGVVELIKRLRTRYQVGMLSNQIQTWHHMLMQQWDLTWLFDPIVTSYGEGVAKPDPLIYQRLLTKLQLPANTCLYIDDREGNLPPARMLGMETIHFQSLQQLLDELKKFQILI